MRLSTSGDSSCFCLGDRSMPGVGSLLSLVIGVFAAIHGFFAQVHADLSCRNILVSALGKDRKKGTQGGSQEQSLFGQDPDSIRVKARRARPCVV